MTIEVGQEVWVRGTVSDVLKHGHLQVHVENLPDDMHPSTRLFLAPGKAIPVSPPLDAPDGEGMWVQFVNGATYARQVRRAGNGPLFFWDTNGASVHYFAGTWYRIPDGLFGAGEKPAPKPECFDMKFIQGCADAVKDECDNFVKRMAAHHFQSHSVAPQPRPPHDGTSGD